MGAILVRKLVKPTKVVCSRAPYQRRFGQILPPSAAEIRIETADGTTYDIVVDESGFFELPTLPAGAMRLRCDTATGRVVTDWVQL